ncbi:MAG: secretion system protein [Pelotomaculum sp.]|uniref:Flp pilus assembly protein TadC n=1 Tax=Pelotomaculum thermopropionicum (strain DSM 13744 / JCM 10971 / SI) TaxID=370438 RepID=A5D290_PELTS|nr:secretion system protein [Pelotomaculum sp.]BAF59633.1 flp pilus assembly protein TadC [Pelotomaculum thermopropionicum SI]
MSPLTIAVLVFLSVLLFSQGLQQLIAGEKETVAVRMERILGNRMYNALARARSKGGNAGTGRRVLELAGRFFTARKITDRVDAQLARADIPLKGEEFLGLVMILSIGGGLFIFAVTGSPVAGSIAAVLGVYLPCFILRLAKTKRLVKFNGQIGDALIIMANSLRSGFSFLQAMDMVRKEMPGPIAKEFGAALQEMNWGTPTEEALLNMVSRVNSEDLELVVTAVLIQRQVGGNLAEVLDKIAFTIRERVRIKREIKTLTAQGRISGLIIGLLPIFLSIAIFLLNHAYMKVLFTSKAGLTMVSCAVLFQVLGLALIKKIIKIPV